MEQAREYTETLFKVPQFAGILESALTSADTVQPLSRRNYDIWIMAFDKPLRHAGNLSLEKLTNGPSPALIVESSINVKGSSAQVKARMDCREDALMTVFSWERRFCALDNRGKEIAATVLETYEKNVTGLLACNWSLLDAVQRLSTAETSYTFDMLEDLYVIRSGQEIVPVGPQEVAVNGTTHRLDGFLQTGAGGLPVRYWLDEQKRLILCAGAMRLLVLNAGSAPKEGEHAKDA